MKSDQIRRRIFLGVSSLSFLGISGCFSMMAGNNRANSQVAKQGEIVLNDVILAIGRPDTEFTKQVKNANAVAFFGKENTYLLAKGGERLMSFAKDLDSKKITLIPDSGSLFISDKTVWGQLRFTYDGANATAEEKKTLLSAGFSLSSAESGVYAAVVPIQGAVYPSNDLSKLSANTLNQARSLSFRAPTTYETKPDLSKSIALPLAIVADVITAPLQMLGFLGIAFGIEATGKRAFR